MNFAQWYLENWEFVSGWDQEIPTEDGFVYHGTNDERLWDIISSGYVDIFKPWHGTEQEAWPDGSREKRSYWTLNAMTTKSFHPEFGSKTVIRTPYNKSLFKTENTGDLYSKKKIPINIVQVLTRNGWIPLTQLRNR